jgi:hypothetical protein
MSKNEVVKYFLLNCLVDIHIYMLLYLNNNHQNNLSIFFFYHTLIRVTLYLNNNHQNNNWRGNLLSKNNWWDKYFDACENLPIIGILMHVKFTNNRRENVHKTLVSNLIKYTLYVPKYKKKNIFSTLIFPLFSFFDILNKWPGTSFSMTLF